MAPERELIVPVVDPYAEMKRRNRRALLVGVAVGILLMLAFWLLGVIFVDQAFGCSLIQAM